MGVRTTESGLSEGQERQVVGLSKAVTIALFIWFTIVSFLITGYQHIYGSNHPFQLLLVQRLNDPTLYPNDPFADTVFDYASVLWYVVAWLSRFVDLSVVLFVFFLINKLLFLLAGFRLARTFFPDSRYAPIIGLATMSTFPQLLFGGGYITDSTQQSSIAIGALLLTLDALLNKKWLSFALWLGLAVNLNLMFSIFGISYAVGSWLVHLRRNYTLDFLGKAASAILGGLILGAPAIYLTLRASTHEGYDVLSVWKTCELAYPYHFYPQLWEIERQLLALLLMIGVVFVVYRYRNASPVDVYLIAWTGVAIGWYLLAWLNPLLIQSIPILRLHPIRALVLWQLPTIVFLVSFLMKLAENNEFKNNLKHVITYLLYLLIIILLIFIAESLTSKLFMGIVAGSIIAFELGRRALLNHLAGSGAFLLAALVVFVVSIYSIGVAFRSILKGHSILSITHTPAIQMAEWARRVTPKEAVFLIPIHHEGNWRHFRHLSQRNVFTHMVDGAGWPFAPWFADEWLERLRALGFFETLGIDERSFKIGSWIHIWSHDGKNFILVYDKVDDNRVEKLKQRYRIDYWITRANVETRFPKVYEYKGWKVLRVSE